ENARWLFDNRDVIKTDNARQDNAKLMVMLLPVMLRDYGAEGDCQQQHPERQHDEPVRASRGDTQKANHPAIGLMVALSVNETRVHQRMLSEILAGSCRRV